MGRGSHRRAACRAVAALVALALSGLPRLVSAALVVEPEHRCQCASHGVGHVCACAVCRARVRAARRDAAAKLPPCHRGAALAELAREDDDRGGPAPCLRPSCGGDPDAATRLLSSDAFTIPLPPAVPADTG